MVTIENYPYDINDSEEVKLAWVAQENQRLLEESYTHEQIDALTEAPNHTLIESLEFLALGINENGETVFETPEQLAVRHAQIVADELAAYKATLHARLTAREEAEALRILNEKKAAQSARIEAHFRLDGGVPWRTGIFDDPNPLKQMNDLLGSDELTAKLDILDISKDAYLSAQAIKEAKEHKKKVGREINKRCEDAYCFVTGYNFLSGKTSEQIDQMEADFTQIQKALKAGRPDKAATLISAVANSEYQELKLELLEILSGA